MSSPDQTPDANIIMNACKELLASSELAYNHAATRDFVGLATAIDRRGLAINTLKDLGDLTVLPRTLREPIQDTLKAVARIDEEIAKVLRRQMAADQRSINDITAKVKAFSAYDRVLPRTHNFDRQK